MTTSMPTLVYFACRSRGEPIRLACALGGIQFEELSVPEEQHNGRRQLPPPPCDPKPTYAAGDAGKLNNPASFPFGTCPKWVETVDGRDILINQSNAILRHVGRRAELYGSSVAEAALVDVWLDHVEDVRKAYNDVIYGLDEPPFDEALTNDSPRVAAAFEAHKPKVVESFGPFEARLAAVVAGGGTAATPVLVGQAQRRRRGAIRHLRCAPALVGRRSRRRRLSEPARTPRRRGRPAGHRGLPGSGRGRLPPPLVPPQRQRAWVTRGAERSILYTAFSLSRLCLWASERAVGHTDRTLAGTFCRRLTL